MELLAGGRQELPDKIGMWTDFLAVMNVLPVGFPIQRVHPKVLRPLPGRRQWPLVRDILLAGFADDPCEGYFLLSRNVFECL